MFFDYSTSGHSQALSQPRGRRSDDPCLWWNGFGDVVVKLSVLAYRSFAERPYGTSIPSCQDRPCRFFCPASANRKFYWPFSGLCSTRENARPGRMPARWIDYQPVARKCDMPSRGDPLSSVMSPKSLCCRLAVPGRPRSADGRDTLLGCAARAGRSQSRQGSFFCG